MINPNGGSYRYEMDFAQRGWVCPRCGRVNAPFMPFCTCIDENKKVSYTTETETDTGTDTTAKNTPLSVPEMHWCRPKGRICEYASIWNECISSICMKEYDDK